MMQYIVISDCCQIINKFTKKSFISFLDNLRNRPFPDDTTPPKMTAVEMMQYITENNLTAEFLRVSNKLYKRFGMIGAPLSMYATIYCYFDLINSNTVERG